jgi:hypothetical protein
MLFTIAPISSEWAATMTVGVPRDPFLVATRLPNRSTSVGSPIDRKAPSM